MIILAVTLPIKPDRREDAVQIVLEMEAETRKEPGYSVYAFHVPLSDPNTFFVYEEWADQAALDYHNNSDHMKVFGGRIGEVLSGSVEVKRHDVG